MGDWPLLGRGDTLSSAPPSGETKTRPLRGLGAGGTVLPAPRPRGFTGCWAGPELSGGRGGTRPLSPKTQLPSRAPLSWGLRDRCPGTGPPPGRAAVPPFCPTDPPSEPHRTALTVAAAGPLPPAWARSPWPSERGAGGGTGARSSAEQSRAASSLRPGGHTYTHGGTALAASNTEARAAQQGSPGPLGTRAPGDGVSAAAARRRRCGDTRVCRGTGGSGWSGTCGNRVGGWSAWGGGPTAPGAPCALAGGLGHLRSSPPPPEPPGTRGQPRPPASVSPPGRVGLHGEGALNVDGVPLVLERAVAQRDLRGEGGVVRAGTPRLGPGLATWP